MLTWPYYNIFLAAFEVISREYLWDSETRIMLQAIEAQQKDMWRKYQQNENNEKKVVVEWNLFFLTVVPPLCGFPVLHKYPPFTWKEPIPVVVSIHS